MKIGCRETSDFFCAHLKICLILWLAQKMLYLCRTNSFLSIMHNIDWKKALVFLIVIGGLIYITKAELGMTTTNSFLTTLGILLLLFIGDNFAQKIDDDRKRRKLNDDGKAN